MLHFKRQIAFSSVLVLLVYLVPNLLQVAHHILGHQTHFGKNKTLPGTQLCSLKEECPVCVFEFNVVSETQALVYIPVLKSETFIFSKKQEDQFQNIAFKYNNLRAPPQS